MGVGGRVGGGWGGGPTSRSLKGYFFLQEVRLCAQDFQVGMSGLGAVCLVRGPCIYAEAASEYALRELHGPHSSCSELFSHVFGGLGFRVAL